MLKHTYDSTRLHLHTLAPLPTYADICVFLFTPTLSSRLVAHDALETPQDALSTHLRLYTPMAIQAYD